MSAVVNRSLSLIASCLAAATLPAAEPPTKPAEDKSAEIAGKAEFLRGMPKHFAELKAVDAGRRTVTLLIEGDTLVRGLWPAHLTVHFSHLIADPFLNPYVHGRLLRNALLAGDLTLDGPVRRPGEFKLAGSISSRTLLPVPPTWHGCGRVFVAKPSKPC